MISYEFVHIIDWAGKVTLTLSNPLNVSCNKKNQHTDPELDWGAGEGLTYRSSGKDGSPTHHGGSRSPLDPG
jgi:hypothetical protein